MKQNGFVLWEGPSPIDGSPIAAIVVGLGAWPSQNTKTGPMAQAYILRSDIDPSEAIADGGDRAICGDCQHRSAANARHGEGNIGRSCYVIWWTGPLQVWKAYKAGAYPRLYGQARGDVMIGHHLRLGAYGDPAMVPYRDWLDAVRMSSGAIGYTQQWRTCDRMFARILMASVQSPAEQLEAQALGYRTFRTRPAGGKLLEGECICPASHEGHHAATCEQCQLCSGSLNRGKNVAIFAHGLRVKWFREAPQ